MIILIIVFIQVYFFYTLVQMAIDGLECNQSVLKIKELQLYYFNRVLHEFLKVIPETEKAPERFIVSYLIG